MKFGFAFTGVLLLAAPLLLQSETPAFTDPMVKNGAFQWFGLMESPDQVRALLGEPRQVADSGADYVIWQFQIEQVDTHDFSHYLIFRKSTAQLISVGRNYEEDRPVDAWFPEKEAVTYYWTQDKVKYPVRVRHLSGGRLLIAMGVSAPGQPASQLTLIRETELANFYPWLAKQMVKSEPSK